MVFILSPRGEQVFGEKEGRINVMIGRGLLMYYVCDK